jgi:prepilin signal peptidase PulO-like enzyme (type II secretory pathway)
MLLFGSIFLFCLGSALGSFANVFVIRLHHKETLMGRSHCMSCKKTLSSGDLIPILGWFFLGGRCRYCRRKIHWQYPVVEMAMAVLSLIIFLRNFNNGDIDILRIVFELCVVFTLLVLTVFDLKWKLVPIEILLVSGVLIACIQLLLGVSWIELALGVLVGAGSLGAIVLLSRGRMMGEGDPFVGALMGVTLGFPLTMFGIFSAFMIGGTVATALLIQGKVGRKTQVPFVPFLTVGTLIALWWGRMLLPYFGYVV